MKIQLGHGVEIDVTEDIAGHHTERDLLLRLLATVKHHEHKQKKRDRKTMSALSDFLAKQTAFNSRQATAIDAVVAGVAGVSADVDTLNAKITELQNSIGTVSPEDQAAIDSLQAQGEALSTKLEAASTALTALDAANPPPPPPTP